MTKEVYISIKGMQFEPGVEEEEIESIQFGEYYQKGNTRFLLFEEMTEGSREVTKNILRMQENALYVTKKGLMNVQMSFEEHKKSSSSYQTPFGTLLMGIDTHNISWEETQDRIVMRVEYALDVNYEHLADCKIIIEVRPKGSGNIRLQA